MKIEWLAGWEWWTIVEDVYEDLEVCLAEREIAIEYWEKSLK